MRMLCEACERAEAVVFCAADEAALCCSCDDKVHLCNKLASQHVRVGLAVPSDIPRCDICENAPDGTSLCLQCDMVVHVGGKRMHGRYLLFRQRVEFPGDNPASQRTDPGVGENQQNHRASPVPDGAIDGHAKFDTKMIDLNMQPQQIHGRPNDK